MLSRQQLTQLYIRERRSSTEIARRLGCSVHRVNYWLAKYALPKRSIAEATYAKYNPGGDPFVVRTPRTLEEAKLLGIGLGLYWGEGTKSDPYGVRLANTDPQLIKKFIEFLERTCGVKRERLRFGLQVFSDISSEQTLRFWRKELGVRATQFQKVTVTPARSLGTYRNKSEHGVLTVQYYNTKLRAFIGQMVRDLTQRLGSSVG